MKYLEFYCKVFNRYKIIVYGFIALILYLQTVIFLLLFIGLTLYECISLILELKEKKQGHALARMKEERELIQVRIIENKTRKGKK